MNETDTVVTGISNSFSKYPLSPALEQDDGGKTKGAARALVRIERRSRRLLDPDNLWGSVKPILDCLRLSKLIVGDGPDQIRLEVAQTKVKSAKEIGTFVEIEYGN
jgi:hypothetical protein